MDRNDSIPRDYKQVSNTMEPSDVTHIMLIYPLPYCLYIPDGNMPILVDGKPAYVTHFMIKSDTIRGFPPDIKVPKESRVINDRWGRQSFTLISISFPKQSWPENYQPQYGYEKPLVSYSLRYINKLIHSYKHVTKEYLCDELTEIDITYFECLKLNSTKKELDRTTHLFPFNNGLLAGEKIAIFDNKKSDEIKSLLISNYEVPPSKELGFDANSFLLKGEYGLAVLLAAVSFESGCKDIIRRGYLKKGTKTKEQIDELFESCSFTSLAKDHIRKAADFDFGTTKEFNDWYTDVREIRNELAHGENPSMNKTDADKIFKILNAANKILDTIKI